jgi:hypothetical protein
MGEATVAKLATNSGIVKAIYEHWKAGAFSNWSDMLVELVKALSGVVDNQSAVISQYMQNKVPPIRLELDRESMSNLRANTGNNKDAGKYGAVYNFERKLKKDEPWFAIRGQDKLAPRALMQYMQLMAEFELPQEAIRSVGLLVERIEAWQQANETKLPD